ncbi:MAG: hypothetical protein ACR2KV_07815 [Solirubrobacteraceae bacterium]
MLALGDDTIAAYDEEATRIEGRPELEGELVKMLVLKSATLDHVGRRADALAVLADVISRFDTHQDPNVRSLISTARGMREEMLEH